MNTKMGNRIRLFREQKDFSQEYMADKLHISRPVYSRIETGETNKWIMMRILPLIIYPTS